MEIKINSLFNKRLKFAIAGIIAISISFLSCSPDPLVCDLETEMAYNMEREKLGIPVINDSIQVTSPLGSRQCYWEIFDKSPTSESYRYAKAMYYDGEGQKTAESDYYRLKSSQDTFNRLEVRFAFSDEEKFIFPWQFWFEDGKYREISPDEAKKRLSEAGFEELVQAIQKYYSYNENVPDRYRF